MIKLFRNVAFIEGVSSILLFFIAMPLKYFWDKPLMVKYVGLIHGLLFIAYVIVLLICARQFKWTIKRVVSYFIASILPFVPFIVERKLKQEYEGQHA